MTKTLIIIIAAKCAIFWYLRGDYVITGTFLPDIEYLKETLPESIEPEFFDYLHNLTASDVTLYAVEEGSVVFPRCWRCCEIKYKYVTRNFYLY